MLKPAFLHLLLPLGAGAALASGGGATLTLDPRLKFPVPGAQDLPLVQEGVATLPQLVDEGRERWVRDAQLEGEPFGVPVALFDGVFGGIQGETRDRVIRLLEDLFPTGLAHDDGADLPYGLVRAHPEGRSPVVTQNCSACHSGVVNGHLIPGVGNKWYDQKSLIRSTRLLMQASLPLLALGGASGRGLLADTRGELTRLERYESLYTRGCDQLGPGMITAARIWQISSKLLHDPEQLATPEGLRRFPCGETKPPALNTLRYRNLYFWDGAVNTLWVAHWPMFDFFGFDDYDRWERLVRARPIQAVDAFLEWGTRSPAWEEVMDTRPRPELAARGYRLFHREGSCASCHGSYSSAGMLTTFQPSVTPLNVIRTDPERTLAASDELLSAFTRYGWASVPRLEGLREFYGYGYQPVPLCSPFLNFPYLHTAGVANLHELLLPEEKRSRAYWLSDLIDQERVGLFTGPTPPAGAPGSAARSRHRKFADRLVSGHSGERFGTSLSPSERMDLVEYLKTLRCP